MTQDPQQDRLDDECDKANYMRSRLVASTDIFRMTLLDWREEDFADAEQCLLSIIRDFYHQKTQPEVENTQPDVVSPEDLPF